MDAGRLWRITYLLAMMLTASLAASCSREPAEEAAPPPPESTMTLTSSAFADGGAMPRQYTGDGQDLSPPLAWDAVPEGTLSFALIMEDPDAPLRTFTHWLICDIPATTRALPEGIPKRENVGTPVRAVQGVNGFRKVGYGGPMPPKGATHRYVFTLYALDAALDLPGGFNRNQLREAMRGQILAQGTLKAKYGH